MLPLNIRVEKILIGENFEDSLDDILAELIRLNNSESLLQVIRLARGNYGGGTYKWELKWTACAATLNWGEEGLTKLSKSIGEDDPFHVVKTIISFLGYVAAGSIEQMPFVLWRYKSLEFLKTNQRNYQTHNIKFTAKCFLTELVKNVEREEKFPSSILASISIAPLSEAAQEQIFGALVMRWFHLNPLSADKYLEVINSVTATEADCHNFLAANPYLIDPFYAEVWSKPRLGEKLQADFVIRSIDNSYTIIEIEDPHKPILTKNGNFSKETTHAKRQALEYREWTITNQLYAEKGFPSIWRPTSLVVIGLEGNLSPLQRERLKQENESTEGKLKVVGFDWIYLRAKATFENILKYGFEQRKISL